MYLIASISHLIGALPKNPLHRAAGRGTRSNKKRRYPEKAWVDPARQAGAVQKELYCSASASSSSTKDKTQNEDDRGSHPS